MTTEPQVKAPTKAQVRLERRRERFDAAVKSNKSGLEDSTGAFHRPGSVKKPAPLGRGKRQR